MKSRYLTNKSIARMLSVMVGVMMVLGMITTVGAVPISWNLSDHPDGNANPPPYGLRLDGIESYVTHPTLGGLNRDIWTFSFVEGGASVIATFDDVAETFTIAGTVYGGRDENGSSTPGHAALEFVYSNVESLVQLENGLFAPGHSGAGTLTFIDNIQSIDAGTVVGLGSHANSNDLIFRFTENGHRLNSHCPAAGAICDNPVAFGWLGLTSSESPKWGTNTDYYHVSAQDFLVTSTPTPEPGTWLLMATGLAGVIGYTWRKRSGRA